MGFVRRLTGKTAADAATKAAGVQVQAGKDASALLDPYAAAGATGLEQAGFLTDPNAQYDFVRNNPLFTAGLENANNQTMNIAAARGRLSSGDTLQSLSSNALLAAAPLISDQKNSITSMMQLGNNAALNQGNLLTGQGAAQAAGMVGAENARGAGYNNLLNLGGQVLGSAAGQGLINKGLGLFGLGGK